jgi:hypothetical protein
VLGRGGRGQPAAILALGSDRSSKVVRWYRFGWSDSSPIYGRDWFLSKHVRVDSSKAFQLMQAAHALSLDRDWLQRKLKTRTNVVAGIAADGDDDALSDSSDDNDVPRGTVALDQQNRSDLCQALVHGLVYHIHVPCSLGSGKTDLLHKCSSWAHQVGLDRGTDAFPSARLRSDRKGF